MKTPEFLRIEEVAERLRASVKTVRRRISEGKIKSFKEGGRVCVLSAELERYLSSQIEKGSRI